MDRRTFVGAFASLPLAGSGADAQSATKVYRVGYFTWQTADQATQLRLEFTEGLRSLGYVDGRNIVIESHYGDGKLERLPELAAAVARSRVDVIVTGTNPLAAAAKRARRRIADLALRHRLPAIHGLRVLRTMGF